MPRRLAVVVILTLVVAAPAHAGPSFTGLGVGTLSATDLSSDGSVVVGIRNTGAGPEAFRWTAAGGVVGLGDLPGGAFQSVAWGVSGDGSVVVGYSTGSTAQAFRWTAAGGMTSLGAVAASANDASADGSVVVGLGSTLLNNQAFRWTADGGVVGLGDLAGGLFSSTATATSADGSVVVGMSSSALGNQAFRWTADGGMVGLGDLPGGAFDSYAWDVSPDGSVVVGASTADGDASRAFRWTASGGMLDLGVLPGSFTNPAFSAATGVSADGSVVVGRASSPTSAEAVIWDEANGMRELDQVLTQLGVDLGDWILSGAEGISADGLTIVGYGSHGIGGPREAWIAVIPEPASGALLGLGLLMLAARRRGAAASLGSGS